MDRRVWLISGCSSGFGRRLAERCIARGDFVAATARQSEVIADLVAGAPDQVITPPLDVSRPDQVRTAVTATLERFGRIDVLVNNAGFAQAGMIENVSDADVRAQFDVNFFGALDLIRSVLPAMRKRRSGRILNISSGGGMTGNVAFGVYCASKFALEGATEALAQEVRPFGIDVSLIEPGAFATKLTVSARIASGDEEYAPIIDALQAAMPRMADTFEDPELVVDCIMQVADAEEPPLRTMVGDDSLAAADTKAKLIASQVEDSAKMWSRLRAARS